MRINKSLFYIIPILIFFLTEALFIPYPYDVERTSYHDFLLIASKTLPFGAMVFVLINLWKLRKSYFILCAIPVLYIGYLVFESLFFYNSYFKFPHVGLKIMDLVITCFFFLFFLKRDFKHHNLLMNTIIAALIMTIMLEPSQISIAAFVNHDRGIPSSSVYLLLLPCLYFFNQYIVGLRQIDLFRFFLLFVFIIFAQHRTVWVAMGASFLFNFYLLNKQGKLRVNKAVSGFIPIGITIFFVVSTVLTYLPDVVDKIDQNIDQILNPDKQGSTSEWRLEQFRSYIPFIKEHFLEGMRLKGFELPIQFYNPNTSLVEWAPGTGHHFHSFYFDKLFYFGLIGFILFLIYMIRPIYRALSQKLEFTHKDICFISFVFSGFIYGLGYNLPTHFFVILGISMAVVEKAINQQKYANPIMYS